jgi:DNA-directed RNA polymerase specialized sigma24 family protein
MLLSSSALRTARLADPALRTSLSDFVRSRVPADDVEDIVQATLAEALASNNAPDSDDEVAAWVHGIARHKVLDWYRRGRRELPHDPADAEAVAAAESAPQSARDLLRWARRELPDGPEHERTLEWMLREGAGEKLEAIAADEDLPAPRIRQRVFRLRKHYRARWAAQAVLVAAILAVAALVLLRKKHVEEIAPLPSPLPLPSAPVLPAPAPPEERPAQPTDIRPDAGPAPAPTTAPRSSVAPHTRPPKAVPTDSLQPSNGSGP